MTTQAPNPLTYWKDLYDQFEQNWTRPMHELLGTESFVASMSATRDSYLTSQKAQREAMESYLKSLHMPTKSDFTGLASLVVSQESKLEGLDDRFDGLDERLSGLEGRFDSLEAKLDTLLAAVAKLAATPSAPVMEAVVPSTNEAPEASVASQAAKRSRAK